MPEASDRLALQNWLPVFIQRRRWTGVVRVRLKQTGVLRYFDCALHAIVQEDAVTGISGFARDVTKERESETRFTELFQTLREGVYLASADDRITEVNPALAQMLGFENKEELLNCEIASLYRKPEDRAEEQNLLNNLGFLRAHEIPLQSTTKKGATWLQCIPPLPFAIPPASSCATRAPLWTSLSNAKWSAACTASRNSRAKLMDSFPRPGDRWIRSDATPFVQSRKFSIFLVSARRN